MDQNTKTIRELITPWAALCAIFAITSGLALAGLNPVGFLVGSVATTIDGHDAVSGAALFDEDNFRVGNNGLAVAKLSGGREFVLGRDSVASISQGAGSVILNLNAGRVSIQAEEGKSLRVKAGELLIEPVPGGMATGYVALINGQLSVMVKEGHFRLSGPGLSLLATKGKPISLGTRELAQKPSGAGTAVAAGNGHGVAGKVALRADTVASPTAIAHVAAHVPQPACQHAAS